jgi:cytochrome oxidase assembly protein ShyY1
MRIDEASKDRQDQSAQVIASNEKTETSLETHRIYRVGLAYGRLVYRFRWFVLAFWLIVLAASVPFASKLPAILSSGGYCSDFHTQTYANTRSHRISLFLFHP